MIQKFLEISFKKEADLGPLYQQLESEIIRLICHGILKPGQALPSSRELAKSLQLNRKTVVAAYEELSIQGWVEARDRSGVYVSAHLPDTSEETAKENSEKLKRSQEPGYAITVKQPYVEPSKTNPNVYIDAPGVPVPLYRIDDGFPDPRIAPVEEIVREYRRFGKSHLTNRFLMYGDERGSYRLRVELAKFLNRTRGLQITEKEILITKGTQMAIYLSAQLLIQPGDTVLVPEPGYRDANQAFRLAGADLVFVPVDKEGMDVDMIEQVCKKRPPRMVYIIPHHHRPTTVTLSAERRMRLMNLASKYGFAVLEDDYDFEYHFTSDPLFPLASMDTGRHIIYVGSFCKSIAPGIRVGFMVAPEVVINGAGAIRKLIDRQGERLLEEAVAELLNTGEISRHLKKSHRIYQGRLENACGLLRDQLGDYLTFDQPKGGLAIWAAYREDIRAKTVAMNAGKMGLHLSEGGNYFFQPDTSRPQDFVRIGFCSLNESEMAEAVHIWKRALIHSEQK